MFCSQLNCPALLWNLIINLQVRWTEFIKNNFLILLWSRVALFRVLIQDSDMKKNESKYGILLENATFHRIYVCIIIIFFYFIRRLQSQTPRNSFTSRKWEGMPIETHAIKYISIVIVTVVKISHYWMFELLSSAIKLHSHNTDVIIHIYIYMSYFLFRSLTRMRPILSFFCLFFGFILLFFFASFPLSCTQFICD